MTCCIKNRYVWCYISSIPIWRTGAINQKFQLNSLNIALPAKQCQKQFSDLAHVNSSILIVLRQLFELRNRSGITLWTLLNAYITQFRIHKRANKKQPLLSKKAMWSDLNAHVLVGFLIKSLRCNIPFSWLSNHCAVRWQMNFIRCYITAVCISYRYTYGIR